MGNQPTKPPIIDPAKGPAPPAAAPAIKAPTAAPPGLETLNRQCVMKCFQQMEQCVGPCKNIVAEPAPEATAAAPSIATFDGGMMLNPSCYHRRQFSLMSLVFWILIIVAIWYGYKNRKQLFK